jgi:hypothetical protein
MSRARACGVAIGIAEAAWRSAEYREAALAGKPVQGAVHHRAHVGVDLMDVDVIAEPAAMSIGDSRIEPLSAWSACVAIPVGV